MKIKQLHKPPIVLTIGGLLLLVLTACQAPKTPAETAMAFWSALTKNNIAQAKTYCNIQSQELLATSQHDHLQNATFSFGEIVINADKATVKMQMTQANKAPTSFITFLIREDGYWKVDYQQTMQQFSTADFVKDLFKNLDKLGKQFNKQLEQQIPLIEKEIESFGQELKQQIDELGKNLNKPSPQKEPTNPYQKTI